MTTQYIFGQHEGHLTARADEIAERHGAEHVNYTEPCGDKRGWFTCENRGRPFDHAVAKAVEADIEAEGGIVALFVSAVRHGEEDDEEIATPWEHINEEAQLSFRLRSEDPAAYGIERRWRTVQEWIDYELESDEVRQWVEGYDGLSHRDVVAAYEHALRSVADLASLNKNLSSDKDSDERD